MRRLIPLILTILFPAAAAAKQLGVLPDDYFRPLSLTSPQTAISAYVDVEHPGNTSIGTSIALITHSPKDGCLFPSIVCEDWSPVAVDYSANAGRALFGLGPSANLAPAVRGLMVRGLLASGLTYRYAMVQSLTNALRVDDPDLTISFGPKWFVAPSQNWKGYFRLQAGAAWRW